MTAASADSYDEIMHELDGKIPMFAFDTVNYGESYRTSREPSMDYIAKVMLEAIINLGIDKFHAFGHHTGASIATVIGDMAPDRLLSAILSGPNYANQEEMAFLYDKLAVPNPLSIKGTQFITAWTRMTAHFPANFWAGDKEKELQAAIMNRDAVDMLRAGEDWCWGYRAVFSHDLPAAMKKLKCPIFFVCGGKDLAYPFHLRATEDFPNAQTYVYPEGGVYYAETHPEDLAPHLLKFIQTLQC
jgi:pimeloyl-ACP methyl ester carboxylesterase